MNPDTRPRGVASQIKGRGAILRSLRLLMRRVEQYGTFRAATDAERRWSLRLADALAQGWRDAMTDRDAQASLAAAEHRAAVSRKTPPPRCTEAER